jgi:dethiobiotin synthetase
VPSRAVSLFVTGTDTGVGKTVVSTALARAFRDRGLRVGVLKPVETGWPASPGAEVATDGGRLREAAGDPESLAEIVPVRLAEPLAPAVAAERAGVRIDVDDLVERAREKARRVDLLLLEGAGGLLVPLAPARTTLDLVAALGATVLVVAGNRLGVINHTLLTVERLAAANVPIVGVVLNRLGSSAGLAESLNPGSLERLLGPRYLGELPWLGDRADAASAAAALSRTIDLDDLWRTLATSPAR